MLNNSWNIGKFFGIPARIHWSFLLIIAYTAGSALQEGKNWHSILVEVVFVLTVFLCVLLHEYGHAITAKKYDIQTEDIILLPIGGVARLRGLPQKPIQEVVIALMGPAVNVIIALILWMGLMIFKVDIISQLTLSAESGGIQWSSLVPYLIITNVLLVLFNMIPCFPMDGGRVFRALLSMKWGKLTATKWATRLSQLICILFILVGSYYSYWNLVIIGVVIFLMGAMEYRHVAYDEVLKGITVGESCIKNFNSVPEYFDVSSALNFPPQDATENLLVVNLSGDVSGSVPFKKLEQTARQEPNTRVNQIKNSILHYVHEDAMLAEIYPQVKGNSDVLVVINGANEILGILDRLTLMRVMNRNKF
ncbi:MAG: site-2 protease family protein [Saprospiraceae bacterium]|nr:site-2 protease family protein [Saprospiraceae bacterium]